MELAYLSAWVMAHWRELGELLLILTIIAQAVRGQRWLTLMTLAAQLTYKAAKLADLDNSEKRAWVAAELYKAVSSPLFKKLITEQRCKEVVDWLWDRLEDEAEKPVPPMMTEGGK